MKEYTREQMGMSPQEACERQVIMPPRVEKEGRFIYLYCARCGYSYGGVRPYCSNCGQRTGKGWKAK